MKKILKKFRVVWQFVFLITFFISSYLILNNIFYDYYYSVQFIPSIIGLIFQFTTIFIIFTILNILFVVIFGRIYCSFFCPLGMIQDLFEFILAKIKLLKSKNQINQRLTFITSSILFTIFIISFFFNFKFLTSFLEPFSISSKLPYFMDSVISGVNINVFLFIWISYFFILLILTALRKRIFCLYICPTGFLLRVLSNLSLTNLIIDDETCIECNKCVENCKTSCIDIQNYSLNDSICVRCFNCLSVCPTGAISFKSNIFSFKNSAITESPYKRRNFLKKLGGIILLIVFSSLLKIKSLLPFHKTFDKNKTFPPGSNNLDSFLNKCINCLRCVDICPTNVLQPSANYPYLDYEKSFCDYFCNECSKICPTDAINYIDIKMKQKTALGKSNLNKDICVVYSKNQSCGACAEICPTGAVHMVDYKENLKGPAIDNTICVGCGSCEYACPTRPIRAIKVDPFKNHKKLNIKEQKVEKEVKEEKFPF